MAMIDEGSGVGATDEPAEDASITNAAGMLGAKGEHVSFVQLESEQTKAMPEVTRVSAASRRQRRGKKRAVVYRAKGIKTKERIARLRQDSRQATAEHDAVHENRPPRKMIRLPHWLPYLWVPVVVWL